MSAAPALDPTPAPAAPAAPSAQPQTSPPGEPEQARPRLRAHDDREPGPALAALLAVASSEERAQILELRRDWLARHKPIDRAERLAVEAVVAVLWRLEALAAVEARVLAALRAGARDPRLPGLATLARLRRALCAERERAERDLVWLRENRPKPIPSPSLAPARLEWLAAKLREGAILAPARPAEEAPRRDGDASPPSNAAPSADASPTRQKTGEKAAPFPPCLDGPKATGARPALRARGEDGLARLFRFLFADEPSLAATPPPDARVAA